MEATCQHTDSTRDGRYEWVCGAPIPRLDEGPCQYVTDELGHRCLASEGEGHETVMGLAVIFGMMQHHAYIGPLASECPRGHPVAVLSEAERRG